MLGIWKLSEQDERGFCFYGDYSPVNGGMRQWASWVLTVRHFASLVTVNMETIRAGVAVEKVPIDNETLESQVEGKFGLLV